MLTLQAAKAFSSLTALVLLVYLVTIFFTGFIQRRRNHSKKDECLHPKGYGRRETPSRGREDGI